MIMKLCTYWHSFKEMESIANQAKPNLQMNAKLIQIGKFQILFSTMY